MNKWTLTGALALALAAAAVVLWQGQGRAQKTGLEPRDDKKTARTLTVIGSATIKVKPDGARVNFGVRTSAPTFAAAREANEKKTQALVVALADLKIKDLRVLDAPIEANPEGGPVPGPGGPGDPNKPPPPPGKDTPWVVTRSYTVVLHSDDPKALREGVDRVLRAALDNGANIGGQFPQASGPYLGGGLGGGPGGMTPAAGPRVEFFKENDSAERRRALGLAVAEARDNARALAGGADVKITDTVTISDGSDSPFGGMVMDPTERLSNVAGEIDLTVRVRVTFAF